MPSVCEGRLPEATAQPSGLHLTSHTSCKEGWEVFIPWFRDNQEALVHMLRCLPLFGKALWQKCCFPVIGL